MNRARTVIVLVMLIVLAVTLTGAFLTRGVMADLPFLQARKGSGHDFQWQRPGDCEGATWPRPGRAGRFDRGSRPRKRRSETQTSTGTSGPPSRHEAVQGSRL